MAHRREGLFVFALEFSITFSFSISVLGVNLLSHLREEKTNTLNIRYAVGRQLVPKILDKWTSVRIFQISVHFTLPIENNIPTMQFHSSAVKDWPMNLQTTSGPYQLFVNHYIGSLLIPLTAIANYSTVLILCHEF